MNTPKAVTVPQPAHERPKSCWPARPRLHAGALARMMAVNEAHAHAGGETDVIATSLGMEGLDPAAGSGNPSAGSDLSLAQLETPEGAPAVPFASVDADTAFDIIGMSGEDGVFDWPNPEVDA